MTDSSWDNGGQPTQRKQGMSIWAKLAMGCGVVFLLGLGTCVALGATCAHKMNQAMDGPEWGQLRNAVEQLQTDAGAKTLYDANPDLSKAYPSENAFIQAAQGWRPRLEALPLQKPSLMSGDLSYGVNVSPGHRQVQLDYTNSKKVVIRSRWENGRLQVLEVD